jgi:hypothetical protein
VRTQAFGHLRSRTKVVRRGLAIMLPMKIDGRLQISTRLLGSHRSRPRAAAPPTELPFDLAQDQDTAIRRQLSTIKRCTDRFSADR